MVADGLQAREIAEELKITAKAVEFHKTSIYAKIGVRNAIGAVRWAIREGYIDA
jgi:DNA-binding NarL/FixJ family response regulator